MEVNVDSSHLMVIHDTDRFTDWYDLWHPEEGKNTLGTPRHSGQFLGNRA